jgi:AcrR family transcriptional regulator
VARPRAPTYDDQREQILARAAELFARQGYTATSMNQVAQACGLTKPTLYHYFADKQALLLRISMAHVARLEALVHEVQAALPPRQRLGALIERFMGVYAHAQHEHRVLTEDVRFLPEAERDQVLAIERRVVAAFADAVVAQRPELASHELGKPLAMLLFGMMNWTFTWLRSDGTLSYEALGAIVASLFSGGLASLALPAPAAAQRGVALPRTGARVTRRA